MLETDCFGAESDKRIYIDIQDSLGYKEETEKPRRNDSKLNVTTELKAALTKKWDTWFEDIQRVSIFICCKMAA